jgi:hypothetical protein
MKKPILRALGMAWFGMQGVAMAPAPMTVQQDANSLQVTEPQGGIRKYALDGEPHNSVMETGVAKAVVTASLQGDTIVIGATEPYGGMPGNVELKVTEVWSLSPDGKP